MGQSVLLRHSRKLCKAANRDLECENLLIFHKADVPQRIQSTGVEVAALSCFLRTVGTEQIPFLRVEIERFIIVLIAHLTIDELRQKAAFAHGAQLEHSLDHAQIGLVLADHIKAVEQQAQLLPCFFARRRKRGGHFGQIHRKAHPLDGGRNSVEDIFHGSFPYSVHIPSRKQHKFRITKQPTGAE